MKTSELPKRDCLDSNGFIFMSLLAWDFREDLMEVCPIRAKEGSVVTVPSCLLPMGTGTLALWRPWLLL